MSVPPDSPHHGATRRIVVSSTSLERTADSLVDDNSPNTTGRTTPTKESGTGQTLQDTPFRVGTAQRSKEGAGSLPSASRTTLHPARHTTDPAHVDENVTPLATARQPKQLEMDAYLEAELQGAIFCDPSFVKNFLTVDSTRLQTVLDLCDDDRDAFAFPGVTKEPDLYQPILRALNTIREAVHGGADQNSPSSIFDDVHSSPIPSHVPDTAGIKPDLVLFDGPTQHWETVRMPIEVKTRPTFLKTGMKQLARYARAVFANQLHRRHLYGMVVCSWDATFVRFDRSGILYSKPMDMSGEEFREAFAGLMMLDDEAFGYDTTFTTRARRDGRLEYYVDLPASAFPPEEGSPTISNTSTTTPGPSNRSSARNSPTRRLKVTRTLCHRKSIRGRATIVLRLREVLRPGVSESDETREGAKTRSRVKQEQQLAEVELLATQSYVLKLMWRDPNKRTEGEVLERLVGVYGVAQYLWHSDVFKACNSPNCTGSMDSSCEHCPDKTPDRDNVLVVKNLTDLNIEIPEEGNDGGETMYKAVKTDEYSEAYARRTPRIYCRLLMSTVGSPLCMAESPRQLLQAVLDAILGYWRLVNKGLLHRDISDGNVLMLLDGNGYTRREWKDERTTTNRPDPSLTKSGELLQALLIELDRDPSGMLNDFDLFAIHGGMEAAFFGDSSPENEESGTEDAERGLKRRRVTPPSSQSTPSSGPSKGKARETPMPMSSLTEAAEVDKGVCQRIDFRTGTPTFMSVRVMEVGIGRRYQHHFMDDLESFFWLILWCVAEHVDGHGTKPTQEAQNILDRLDHPELDSISDRKRSVMTWCADDDGAGMEDRLASWGNSWAKNSRIVALIVELGAYFQHVKRRKLHTYTPSDVFPAIVEIILRAINQMSLS
ncbi:hypothetical protein FRC10_011341 [Ceratobasidium sp. 414]|nr:hypothetical protein FRC10_011341 [Ceratobasidium sp. 414]